MVDPEYEDDGTLYLRIAETATEIAYAALQCERFGAEERPPESGQRNDMVLAKEIEDLRRLRTEFVEGQDE
jgi:hypothetical protein